MYNRYPFNSQMFNFNDMYRVYPCPYCADTPVYSSDFSDQFNDRYDDFDDETQYVSRCDSESLDRVDDLVEFRDYGPKPFVINIDETAKKNNAFRRTLWTGTHLQVTLMSINPGESIGLEIHPNTDQFLRIEDGQGIVKMGSRKDMLNYQRQVSDNFAIMIPAGTWHNIINTGRKPLKLYSIYAPPHHPRGTVHKTKADAEAAEKAHNR